MERNREAARTSKEGIKEDAAPSSDVIKGELLRVWDDVEVERTLNVTDTVKSMLEISGCKPGPLLFFGSAITDAKDPYSDVDIIYFYEGDLPNEKKRKEFYLKHGYHVQFSRDADRSVMTSKGGFSEDGIINQNVMHHVDFRNSSIIERIIKDVTLGDAQSFLFLHCLQSGKFFGDLSTFEGLASVLSTIPEKAKQEFLDIKWQELVQTHDSIVKSIIRQDRIRCVELFLRAVHSYIDIQSVENNIYPGKKKDFLHIFQALPGSENEEMDIVRILSQAATEPENALQVFRAFISRGRQIDENHISNKIIDRDPGI